MARSYHLSRLRSRPRCVTGVLVFATAIAVPLQTVSNAVRLAPLPVISGGERAALAVPPLALITVSSSLGPSAIDALALCPDGHQHEQQPGRDGRGGWRRHDLVRRLGPEKNSDPLLVVSVLSRLVEFTLCKICKIRQVVFTTFLNWLLKTALKRICTEARNLT